ncbi:MAG: sensor histidine kinase [Sphingobacteriia bacterium]|nr:MAG: sensor histidine kinase [Sphingobacteriia bacterium]
MIKLRKTQIYWLCQAAGWLGYGLAMIFFAYIFDSKFTDIFYSKLVVITITGILFTHLLREAIRALGLRPPDMNRKWLLLAVIFFTIVIAFNLTNSAIAEWLKLYNPEVKVSIGTRFLINLVSDTPLLLVWLTFYYLWHYIQLGTKTEIQKIRLESLVKELELQTIKSHINPHFIFNALNSIRALVDENPQRARTAITELSNILRSSMQAEKQETVPLERELNIVKDYLALEQIRFEDRLQVNFEIDEDTLDQPIPPMMLQTLVENAIKHGIARQKEGGTVTVISDFTGDHHELIVRNSGCLQETALPDEGFGLSSTRNRLKLLYGYKGQFSIRNLEGGEVEAKIILPVPILQPL